MPINRLGPDGARLVTVSSGDSALLAIASNLFAEIFPEDRRYIPYLRACAQGRHLSHPRTFDHVWLVEQGGDYVGLRVFSAITTRNFGHGAYIGFAPRARGQGLGRWLVEQTHAQLDEDARQFGQEGSIGYLVEVERPIDAESDEEREESLKRLQFHRQRDAIILPVPFIEPVMISGVDYLHPEDLAGESPRPMHLVFIPSARGLQIQNLDLINFVHGIYLDVYRLSPHHEFIQRALQYLTGEKA
jgi:GNAT superfamily N-acetyltransferase